MHSLILNVHVLMKLDNVFICMNSIPPATLIWLELVMLICRYSLCKCYGDSFVTVVTASMFVSGV